jgi:PIN domain
VPQSITELLRARSESILELLGELLQDSTVRDVNDRHSDFVIVGASYAWNELDAAGRRTQSRLLNELDAYLPLVEALVRVAPEGTQRKVAKAAKNLRAIADRSKLSWYSTPEKAWSAAHEAVADQFAAIDALDDPSDGMPIFVVDANAAIRSPDLDDWGFEDVKRFVLLLSPPFLQELDELKITYRVEQVRETAESLIRRINDYWKRGNVHEGVTLRRDRSVVRMVANEPNVTEVLPSLDPSVMDDRYVAVALEVMRRHPRSPVTIVTSDGNLVNKARSFGIPVVSEPPARDRPPKAKKLPDVIILEIYPTGGGPGNVNFTAEVQNHDAKPVRVTATAAVGDQQVDLQPAKLDLLVNAEPSPIRIAVPRPSLGDLVKAFNDETTLYRRALTLELKVDGDTVATKSWTEHPYDEEENPDRYALQQAIWRIGRGEGTEEDLRRDG